jgi:MFS family permease
MTLVLILVIELAGTKRRGLFLGITNAGFTTGVALGAVVAGGLVGVTGWVSPFGCRH